MSIAADALTFFIPICAPEPPFPYFLQASWNTDFFDVDIGSDHIYGFFTSPAPGDGSGYLSWQWANPG